LSDPAVRVEVRPDRVAVLTIDQPGAKVNVLTVALWDELEATLHALPPDLAGLVIASGKPGCFIAGADLKLLANAVPGDPAVKAFIEQGLRVLAKLQALPFPTCAAIDGVALGGGLEVALACDLRILGTHPSVRLGLPEVKLGLIPGWGGTQRLARQIGPITAAEHLLTGDSFVNPGWRAPNGLVTFEYSFDGVPEMACRSVATYARMEWKLDRAKWSGPARGESAGTWPVPETTAAREAVRVVRLGAGLSLAEGIALETEAFLRLAGSAESRAKIAAFFAARKR
jgi:enoyl-CoA hydratase/carnithine racemase